MKFIHKLTSVIDDQGKGIFRTLAMLDQAVSTAETARREGHLAPTAVVMGIDRLLEMALDDYYHPFSKPLPLPNMAVLAASEQLVNVALLGEHMLAKSNLLTTIRAVQLGIERFDRL